MARDETILAESDDVAALPAPVRATRDKILAACATGGIEALRVPIDWNEVRPIFARSGTYKAGTDPIDFLKAQSFDTKGAETLRIICAIFAQPYVAFRRGPATLYEWPAFARRMSAAASEKEVRARWRCVRFTDLARSNAEGRPRPMRICVAADGVWHYFWSED